MFIIESSVLGRKLPLVKFWQSRAEAGRVLHLEPPLHSRIRNTHVSAALTCCIYLAKGRDTASDLDFLAGVVHFTSWLHSLFLEFVLHV